MIVAPIKDDELHTVCLPQIISPGKHQDTPTMRNPSGIKHDIWHNVAVHNDRQLVGNSCESASSTELVVAQITRLNTDATQSITITGLSLVFRAREHSFCLRHTDGAGVSRGYTTAYQQDHRKQRTNRVLRHLPPVMRLRWHRPS